jgi:hypothetical protein
LKEICRHYGNDRYQPVKMVGHHLKSIQQDVGSELSASQLLLDDDFSCPGQIHLAVLDRAKPVFSFSSIYRDVKTTSPIVPMLQPGGFNSVMVSETSHARHNPTGVDFAKKKSGMGVETALRPSLRFQMVCLANLRTYSAHPTRHSCSISRGPSEGRR